MNTAPTESTEPTGKPDPDRIRANYEREFDGWAKSFGTSPERLKRAVLAVGITPRKVRAYLRSMD